MSSLHKFENKFIDYTESDLVRSYLSAANNELDKIHRALGFDVSMKIVKERSMIMASLVSDHFTLSIRHGEREHKTSVKLICNGKLVREMSLVNFYNPKLIDELKGYMA